MAAPHTETQSRKHNSEFVPEKRLADHLGTTDPDHLISSRLLTSDQISRAALFDKSDFLPLGNTRPAPLKVEPDTVRQIYDALLMGQRVATEDPTSAVSGGVPKSFQLENQKWEIEDANSDNLRAKGPDGSYVLVGATATLIVIVQTIPGANPDSATLAIQSFQSALTSLPQGNAL